tara:strand:- start:1969 stop:2226 length:258 start_codon:yes stop_codon:yes gene_type:complete
LRSSIINSLRLLVAFRQLDQNLDETEDAPGRRQNINGRQLTFYAAAVCRAIQGQCFDRESQAIFEDKMNGKKKSQEVNTHINISG